MSKKLIIFGDSAFAEVAYEYFTKDSDYKIVGFTVSGEFKQKDELFGLPVVNFEEVNQIFPESEHEMFIALVYNKLNRIRRQFYVEAKSKGYTLASFVSSKAMVWDNVEIGENTFIFENNVIQPFCKIGSNNVLWSGNHFGHHSTLGNHNFIASHVVISGFCQLGDSGFYGVNSTVGNNVNIGDDCFIGAGALVTRDIETGSFLRGPYTKPDESTSYEKFKVEK